MKLQLLILVFLLVMFRWWCLYRPRLGTSLHHVMLVGVVYLVVGAFEGIRRVITVTWSDISK